MSNFKMTKQTAIRSIILLIALVNQALVSFGLSPFPFTAQEIEIALSYVFTAIATIWAWWKNNSATEEANEADAYMRELKAKNKRKEDDN